MRARFQACILNAKLENDSPVLDSLEHGWTSEGPSGAHCLVSLPSRVEFAPSFMQLFICAAGCSQFGSVQAVKLLQFQDCSLSTGN